MSEVRPELAPRLSGSAVTCPVRHEKRGRHPFPEGRSRAALVRRSRRPYRRARHQQRAAARQPARRPARAAAARVPAAGVRRRPGPQVPGRVRDPGLHRERGHVAEPVAPSGSRSPRPPTRCSPAARRRRPSWCTSTRGPATAAASSWTRQAPARYHSYLCDEVVPWVDARYRTLPDAAHRAIMGKSSGGFGAMITPMLRPDLFGALATHAGDALYEYCYMSEFAAAVRHLRRYDGDIWRWWRRVHLPGGLHQGGGHVAARGARRGGVLLR